MYTEIGSSFIKFEGNKSVQSVEIICDTEADLPTVEDIANGKYATGSVVWIADARTFKVLNSKGEWV